MLRESFSGVDPNGPALAQTNQLHSNIFHHEALALAADRPFVFRESSLPFYTPIRPWQIENMER